MNISVLKRTSFFFLVSWPDELCHTFEEFLFSFSNIEVRTRCWRWKTKILCWEKGFSETPATYRLTILLHVFLFLSPFQKWSEKDPLWVSTGLKCFFFNAFMFLFVFPLVFVGIVSAHWCGDQMTVWFPVRGVNAEADICLCVGFEYTSLSRLFYSSMRLKKDSLLFFTSSLVNLMLISTEFVLVEGHGYTTISHRFVCSPLKIPFWQWIMSFLQLTVKHQNEHMQKKSISYLKFFLAFSILPPICNHMLQKVRVCKEIIGFWYRLSSATDPKESYFYISLFVRLISMVWNPRVL